MNWDIPVYDIMVDVKQARELMNSLEETDPKQANHIFSEIYMDSENSVAYNRQDLVDKLLHIKELGVKVDRVWRRAPRDMNYDVTKSYKKYIIESVQEKHDADYYYDNRIQSKFDKWLDYDFGGIRTYAVPFEDTPDHWYYYEETWNYVGRQSDGKYYFRCSSSVDKNMIGKVLAFNRFNDVARFVALPR